MDSTSSSISPLCWKYEVFLSFRGADTREGFVSHLYRELVERKNIQTFIDDKLSGGKDISHALFEKIEQSNVSVIVFSKNYADSPWCLEELAKIHECYKKKGHQVLPVFYCVDPTHVQELSGKFGNAFAKHENEGSRLGDVNIWRDALKEIANLRGCDSNVTKSETELIDKIVHDIEEMLDVVPSSSSRVLVGIDSHIKSVESLLCTGEPGVRIVGIWGPGGVGKTTIAEEVYDKISSQFEGHWFLRDVTAEKKRLGLVHLKDEIFSKVLNRGDLSRGTLKLSSRAMTLLQRKKVLIVLDDVTDPQDSQALVEGGRLLGPGSRIIVTSRDKQVLGNQCHPYEVTELGWRQALKLFSLHAFQQNFPLEGYLPLSKRAVDYAQGLPLALEVLGSNLSGRPIEDWQSELAKLEETLDLKIREILKMSYDGLDRKEKSIFLDIACFFKKYNKDLIQEAIGVNATAVIRRLVERCLIKMSDKEIWMHDLLQQLGREIVLDESNDPGERSRLWNAEDICRVLSHCEGTTKVETISLDMSEISEITEISATTFKKMPHLRLFEFNKSSKKMEIHLPDGLQFLPKNLVILRWYECPLKCLPSKLYAENLVELAMPYSHLEQLWNGTQPFVKLKRMDLRYSKNLIRIPDLSEFTNLESLLLDECERLVEVPFSIEYCSKLTEIDLRDCKNLRTLPSFLRLTSLESLFLDRCSKIKEFPDIPWSIKELWLRGTAIEQVPPSSIERLSQLYALHLSGCEYLESLPNSIGQLKCLGNLSLDGCLKLANLPNSIYDLESLHHLDLRGCGTLKRLPEPDAIPSSSTLFGGSMLGFNLSRCGISEIPESLGSVVSLMTLDLSYNDFASLPASFQSLSSLLRLVLDDCRLLASIPKLPSSLTHLSAHNCTSLEGVQGFSEHDHEQYEEDLEFNFANCHKLGQESRLQIMDAAQLRIQCFARANSDQAKYYSEMEYPYAEFTVPGSEVPGWFGCQNRAGSSLIFKPSRCNRADFLGCAFCVVVSSSLKKDWRAWFEIVCECNLITEAGGRRDLYLKHLSTDFSIDRTDMSLESEHVFIWYDSRFESEYYFSEGTFKFYLEHWDSDFTTQCKVIRCGVHLLLAQNDEDDRPRVSHPLRLRFIKQDDSFLYALVSSALF